MLQPFQNYSVKLNAGTTFEFTNTIEYVGAVALKNHRPGEVTLELWVTRKIWGENPNDPISYRTEKNGRRTFISPKNPNCDFKFSIPGFGGTITVSARANFKGWKAATALVEILDETEVELIEDVWDAQDALDSQSVD